MSAPSPTRAQVATALGLVYVGWGSTYLAIREAITTVPPLLMGSVRFLLGGALLFAFAIRRGDWRGDRVGIRQWRSAAIVGTMLLAVANGTVVWSEQSVPSSLVALIVATMPLWMALIDRVFTGQRLLGLEMLGLIVGFAGVLLLVGHAPGAVDPRYAALLVLASLSWAGGSVYARSAALPKRPLVATAMEMLVGGAVMLVCASARGEWATVHVASVSARSIVAVAYLIVVGSWLGFSAFVWLLANVSTTVAGTYAYVNPAVAVFLGWAIGREPLSARSVLAGAVVVAGAAMIVTARRWKR